MSPGVRLEPGGYRRIGKGSQGIDPVRVPDDDIIKKKIDFPLLGLNYCKLNGRSRFGNLRSDKEFLPCPAPDRVVGI